MNFHALQKLLDTLLHVVRFAATDDLNGVFQPPARPDAPVRRLGLALEPGPDWLAWVQRAGLDAVFLHRPWGMDRDPCNLDTRNALADAGVGVLAYHLAFDELLTTGFNPALAAACGWGEPSLLAEKEGRPLGMICTPPDGPVPLWKIIQRLVEEFGRLEGMMKPAAGMDVQIRRVACVGAMNDRLVRAAHAAGADLYVTGQWREPARKAVHETAIGVISLGHQSSEEWGLRTLARSLREDPGMGGVEVSVFSGRAT